MRYILPFLFSKISKVHINLVFFILVSSCGATLDLKGWDNNFLSNHHTFLSKTYLKIVSDSLYVFEKPLKFVFYENGMVTSTSCYFDNWPMDSVTRMTQSVSDIGQYFVKNDTIYIQTVKLIGAYGHMRVVAKYKIVKETGSFKLIYYWFNNKSPIKENYKIYEGYIDKCPLIYRSTDLIPFPDVNSWHFHGNWGEIKSFYTWK